MNGPSRGRNRTGNPPPNGRFTRYQFELPLDQSVNPNRTQGLTDLQNAIYRPFGSVSKRSGVSPYGGAGSIGVAAEVLSGVRWYRGRPSTLKQMVVQCNDALYKGTDNNGTFTKIGNLTANSTPAYYASCYDPAESGVGGTPASDILIIAYGSGAPLKYDGTNFVALSGSITNLFAGCHFWHEHVWFWGDPNNPDTIFATDLGNPEGFTFMNSFSPPGYQIGRGDGDPTVQRCIGLGNTMYVFKTASIYAVTGFSFYTGEYPFAISPAVETVGTTNGLSVARLRSSLFFWSGQNFYRLNAGSSDPVPIGTPLINTLALAAAGNQGVIRAVAGDFLIQTASSVASYTNVYLVALDTGDGQPDTILMYDDDASAYLGQPAWSVFKGLSVGCWIPWNGPGDKKLLYYGDGATGQVNLFGGNATADQVNAATTNPISVSITTGRIDCGTPDQIKQFAKAYIEVDSNAAAFTLNVFSDLGSSGTTNFSFQETGNSQIGSMVVGQDIIGATLTTVYQSVISDSDPWLRGHNFQLQIVESSTTSAWSMQGISWKMIEEAYER